MDSSCTSSFLHGIRHSCGWWVLLGTTTATWEASSPAHLCRAPGTAQCASPGQSSVTCPASIPRRHELTSSLTPAAITPSPGVIGKGPAASALVTASHRTHGNPSDQLGALPAAAGLAHIAAAQHRLPKLHPLAMQDNLTLVVDAGAALSSTPAASAFSADCATVTNVAPVAGSNNQQFQVGVQANSGCEQVSNTVGQAVPSDGHQLLNTACEQPAVSSGHAR